MNKRTTILTISFLLLAGCDDTGLAEPDIGMTEQAEVSEDSTHQTKPEFGTWGVDLTGRDEAVKPGDDFFRYVNGTWLDNNEIPADRTGFGVGLIVHERAQQRVRDIIEELGAKSGAVGTSEQKVGDYYASWMDTETVNKLGIGPLQPDLDRIAAIEDVKGLTTEFGQQYFIGGASPFSAGLGIDPKDPDKYNINVGLSGMGLPDRDFYLEDTERFKKIRAAYQSHIAEMLDFAGIDETGKQASAILELETSIATLQWIRADRRDRDKTYNPSKVEALIENYPGFSWNLFLSAAGHDDLNELNLVHPNTLAPLINLVNLTPLATWKSYLSYHMITSHAPLLSEEMDDADFNFWGKIINGQEKKLDRWKRGVSRVASKIGIGEALGQNYVKRHFHES